MQNDGIGWGWSWRNDITRLKVKPRQHEKLFHNQDYINPELNKEFLRYCERFIELMIDLQALLPTRRYLNVVIDDLHLIVKLNICMSSLVGHGDGHLFSQEVKFAELPQMCQFFGNFINFRALSLEKLRELAASLRIIQDAKDEAIHEQFILEALVFRYERRISQIKRLNSMALYPTEEMLWDENVVPSDYHSSSGQVLALPKLNLQFLTLHDYLLRNFQIFRLESTYQIRQDVEDAVFRLKPWRSETGLTLFHRWARMAQSIVRFAVVEVAKPNLGGSKPSRVRADVMVNLSAWNEARSEWESFRELVFDENEVHELNRIRTRTNAKTSNDRVNPAQYGLVIVSSSEGGNLQYGRLEDILNRDSSALNCHTNDDPQSVLSTSQSDFTESVIAGLNTQDDIHPITNISPPPVPVSDVATIVESVSLGDNREDGGLALHLPSKPSEAHKASKSVGHLTKSSTDPSGAGSSVDFGHERCPYDDAEFLNSVKNGKNAVLTAASQTASGGVSISSSNGAASSASKSQGQTYSVFVKTWIETFVVAVTSSTTAKHIIQAVIERTKCSASDVSTYFGNKRLNADDILNVCGIQNSSTVYATLRLLGGVRPKQAKYRWPKETTPQMPPTKRPVPAKVKKNSKAKAQPQSRSSTNKNIKDKSKSTSRSRSRSSKNSSPARTSPSKKQPHLPHSNKKRRDTSKSRSRSRSSKHSSPARTSPSKKQPHLPHSNKKRRDTSKSRSRSRSRSSKHSSPARTSPSKKQPHLPHSNKKRRDTSKSRSRSRSRSSKHSSPARTSPSKKQPHLPHSNKKRRDTSKSRSRSRSRSSKHSSPARTSPSKKQPHLPHSNKKRRDTSKSRSRSRSRSSKHSSPARTFPSKKQPHLPHSNKKRRDTSKSRSRSRSRSSKHSSPARTSPSKKQPHLPHSNKKRRDTSKSRSRSRSRSSKHSSPARTSPSKKQPHLPHSNKKRRDTSKSRSRSRSRSSKHSSPARTSPSKKQPHLPHSNKKRRDTSKSRSRSRSSKHSSPARTSPSKKQPHLPHSNKKRRDTSKSRSRSRSRSSKHSSPARTSPSKKQPHLPHSNKKRRDTSKSRSRSRSRSSKHSSPARTSPSKKQPHLPHSNKKRRDTSKSRSRSRSRSSKHSSPARTSPSKKQPHLPHSNKKRRDTSKSRSRSRSRSSKHSSPALTSPQNQLPFSAAIRKMQKKTRGKKRGHGWTVKTRKTIPKTAAINRVSGQASAVDSFTADELDLLQSKRLNYPKCSFCQLKFGKDYDLKMHSRFYCGHLPLTNAMLYSDTRVFHTKLERELNGGVYPLSMNAFLTALPVASNVLVAPHKYFEIFMGTKFFLRINRRPICKSKAEKQFELDIENAMKQGTLERVVFVVYYWSPDNDTKTKYTLENVKYKNHTAVIVVDVDGNGIPRLSYYDSVSKLKLFQNYIYTKSVRNKLDRLFGRRVTFQEKIIYRNIVPNGCGAMACFYAFFGIQNFVIPHKPFHFLEIQGLKARLIDMLQRGRERK